MKKGLLTLTLLFVFSLFLVAGVNAAVTRSWAPSSGRDTTGATYTMNTADLARVRQSDDWYYFSRSFWNSWWGDEYLRWRFSPGLPNDATIYSTEIRFEWLAYHDITSARWRVRNPSTGMNSGWQNFASVPYSDRLDVIDISSYVDEAADLNGLIFEFEARGSHGWWRRTRHDLVRLRVEYDSSGPIASGTAATPNPTTTGDTYLTAFCDDSQTGNSNISAAEYYIDDTSGTAYNMQAQDGAFDESTEIVEANVTGLSPGYHYLFVRCRDGDTNWGPFDSVLVEVGTLDTTEPDTNITYITRGNLVDQRVNCTWNGTYWTAIVNYSELRGHAVSSDSESNLANAWWDWFGDSVSPDVYGEGADLDSGYSWNSFSRVTWHTTWPGYVTFNDGESILCGYAMDNSNNLESPVLEDDCCIICIDTTPPTQPGKPKHSDNDICNLADQDLFDNDAWLYWNWSPSEDTPECSGFDHYEIEVEEDGIIAKRDTKDTNEYNYHGGKKGKVYRLRVRAVDIAGNKGEWSEWSNEVLVDKDDPIMTITPDSPDNDVEYPYNWYKDDFNVEINMTDELSGLCKCSYEIYDDGNLSRNGSFNCFCNENFIGTVTITVGEGKDCETIGQDKCALYVEVEDKAGNVADDWANFSIDYKEPNTTKTIGNPKYNNGEYITTNTQIILSCDDNGGIGCKEICYYFKNLKTGYEETYCKTLANPWDTLPLYLDDNESEHYLEFWSIDKLGNEEPHYNQTHFVDDSAPITTKTYGEPVIEGWRLIQEVWAWIHFISSKTPIFLNANDCGDADNCSLHPVGVNATWWTLFVPYNPGYETLTINEWYGSITHKWYENYDECGEENGEENCSETTWWNKRLYMEEFCPIENQRWKHGFLWCKYENNITINQSCDHKICYFSEDLLGNQENFTCQMFSVDNTPPEITIENPDSPIGCAMLSFDVKAKIIDNKTGVNESEVYARVVNDDTNETLYDWTKMEYLGNDRYRVQLSNLIPAGKYRIEVKASDKLDNTKIESKIVEFYEDVYWEVAPSECEVNLEEGGNCSFHYRITLCHGGDSLAMKMHKLCCLTELNPKLYNTTDMVYVEELFKLPVFFYEMNVWEEQLIGWCSGDASTEWNYIKLYNFNNETKEGEVTLEFNIPKNTTSGMCDKVFYAVMPGYSKGSGYYIIPRVSYFGIDFYDTMVKFEPKGPKYHECGNGILESDEECDDGNLENGDCCSATCRIEPGCEPPEQETPSSGGNSGSSGSSSGGGGSGGGSSGSLGSVTSSVIKTPTPTPEEETPTEEPRENEKTSTTEQEAKGEKGILGAVIGIGKKIKNSLIPIIAILTLLAVLGLVIKARKHKK